MTQSQSIVPLLAMPSADVISLNLGFPYTEVTEKTAQLFSNATSHCAAVSSFELNCLLG